MAAKAPAVGQQPEEKGDNGEQHQRDRQAEQGQVGEGGKAIRESADAFVAGGPGHARKQQRAAAVEVQGAEGYHQRANAGVVNQRRVQQPAQQAEQQRQGDCEAHRPARLHHHPQRDGAQADGGTERNINPAADDHQRQRQRHDANADKVAGAEQQHIEIQHARIQGAKQQDLQHQ